MIDLAYLGTLTDRFREIEHELADPTSLANQKRYRELVREHLRYRRIVERADAHRKVRSDCEEYDKLSADSNPDAELRQIARVELEGARKRLAETEKNLVIALLPPDPNEQRNVVMEIRAGTGGDEAALFAGDLFRMYSRYLEAKGWSVNVVDASPAPVGGYKEIVFLVSAATGTYGELKYESGCHRVQRVPVTEGSGRIHTSAATVAVLPEADEMDEIEIPPGDLRIDIFCASGPGGQGVNTTYSAVRVTHLPTGLVAQSQDERSQQRNREKALNVMKARLLDWRRQQEESKAGSTRRAQIGSGDRSEKIRTYNFPQNRVTDHRINLTLYTLDRVINGELGDLIAALKTDDMEAKIRSLAPGRGTP